MSVYLKKFENHTQYDNYINGSGAILPNVSICTTEGDVHYNPYVEPMIIAKFNVTNTSSATKIANSTTGFDSMKVDGAAAQTVTTGYTFDSTGEHTVEFIVSTATSIANNAFSGCTKLTEVSIPNSITSIGNNAFNSCNSLTSIDIPNSVTSIGNSAFYFCNSLTSVTIPSSVASIGNNTFYYCRSLTSVGKVGSGASVEIPNSVTSIGTSAFTQCSGLTSVTIPDSVTSISDGTFENCVNLTTATIGNNVARINEKVFHGCTRLTSITINTTTPPLLMDSYGMTFDTSCPIYVPSESVDAYKASNYWTSYSYRIQAIP